MARSAILTGMVIVAMASASAADKKGDSGSVSGKISPEDASVRIIAKLAGTEHRVKKNIKGEVTLTKGGAFTIRDLPAGKYDLLFFLQGKSKKKYMATRWSEVVVAEGETTSGINYRLTPVGSAHLIDEVLVAFEGGKDKDAQETIQTAGCTVKDRPMKLGKTTVYTVDIPDDKSVQDMVEVFQKTKGVKYAEPNGIATTG